MAGLGPATSAHIAEAAGLNVGDVLVSVDGQPAENVPTVSYNFRLRDSMDNVDLVVLRGAKEVRLSVKPVEVKQLSVLLASG